VPACEQITKALDSGEACNVDEFRTKAWIIAVEVDCQLNKAQNVLDLVAKKFQQAAQAAYPYWSHRHWRDYEKLLNASAHTKATWRMELNGAEQAKAAAEAAAVSAANEAKEAKERQTREANTSDPRERARLRAQESRAYVLYSEAMRKVQASTQAEQFLRQECQRKAKSNSGVGIRPTAAGTATALHNPGQTASEDTFNSWNRHHATVADGALGAPAICDLHGCIASVEKSCHRCVGQLHYRTPDNRHLLMLPQPFHDATADAYSYDGTAVRVLNRTMEVKHVDPYKINKGLWYATVLGSQEHLSDIYTFYFSKGVQSRLRYRGNDPAIIMDLAPDTNSSASMCVGRPNKNLIDPGNHREFFSGEYSNNGSRVWPYWQAPSKFLAVASKVTFDEDNKPMGTVTMDVNLSSLAKGFLDKLTITASAYSVIVDQTGRIVVLSERARKTLFNEEITDDEIYAHSDRPRCRMGMTPKQFENCSWESKGVKVMTLADAEDSERYSGANISGVLGLMFNTSKSNCSTGMKQAEVCFPMKEANMKCRLHLVSFCAFSSLPDWGLILGSTFPEIKEAARLNVKSLDPTHENFTVRTYWSRIYVRVVRKVRREDLEAGTEVENEVLHFNISNTGRIELPYEVIIPEATHWHGGNHSGVPSIIHLMSPSRGKLRPGENASLELNLSFRNLTFGNHTEAIIIRSNDEEPRGSCFRKAWVINLQVEFRKVKVETAVNVFLKNHAFQVVWALVILSILVCSMPAALYARHSVRKHINYESMQKLKLDSALDSTDHVAFPMVLMTAKDFKRLGKLVCHEDMMRLHVDFWLYTVDEVKAFSKLHKIIFVSHQWTGFESPDPTEAQYKAMVMSLDTLRQQECWDEEEMYIWVDYFSIPQKHRGTQTLAINSLTTYASNVAAFVVVAPPVKHKDLGEICDKVSYQRRAWCRAEQLSHLLALGTTTMYLAEGDVLTPLRDIADWLQQSQYVFQGDLTCCRRKHVGMEKCDKELLVVPMLGLWAQLYQRHLDNKLSEDQQGVYNSIAERLDEVFPRTFEFVNKKGGIETRTLFGDLTDRLPTAMAAESSEP